MRFRKFGVHYGTVNDNLLNAYKEMYNMKSDAGAVNYLIESRLLFRSIESSEDMEDAKKYAENLLFKDIGEWLDCQMRNDIISKLSICKNCQLYEENNYCPILNAFLNPYQKGCHNMQ